MQLDTTKAVRYHDGGFPPDTLNFERILPSLLAATDALARYDQMLKGLHNSEIFLAPLRNQEAVISSRMEGTISTLDRSIASALKACGPPSTHAARPHTPPGPAMSSTHWRR